MTFEKKNPRLAVPGLTSSILSHKLQSLIWALNQNHWICANVESEMGYRAGEKGSVANSPPKLSVSSVVGNQTETTTDLSPSATSHNSE